MDIRVYDFNFNPLCIMTDIISSAWSLKYNGIGTYEGHFRLSDRISDILLENTYMIIVEGQNQAVCTGKIADGELLICGRTLNWLLSKRAMPPFKTSEVFGESYQKPTAIIEYVLKRTFTEPPQIGADGTYSEGTVDEKKKVSGFKIMTMPECDVLNRHFWRNSANTAEDIIRDLAELMGKGHKLFFNIKAKTWDFYVLEGEEKSIILSEINRNMYDVSYTEEIENYACGGWYEDTTSTESGETAWKYVSFDDGNTGMMYWDAVLSGAGVSEAQSSLEKKKTEKSVQGTLKKLRYGKDYTLGDVVEAAVSFGSFERKFKYKIEGINIWNNESGYGEEPVLVRIKED